MKKGILLFALFAMFTANAQESMAGGSIGYGKMVSVFAASKLVGASDVFAYVIQLIVAGTVSLAVVAVSWRRDWSHALAALVPIPVIAVRHTTMISASITAYSTAVGPSSETRNLFTLFTILFIRIPLRKDPFPGVLRHGVLVPPQ